MPRPVAEPVPKSLLGQLLCESRERQRVGRAALEGPDDDESLLIWLQHRLATASRAVARDISVPEGSTNRPTALGRLLVHALRSRSA
jgi:hypothetical protein